MYYSVTKTITQYQYCFLDLVQELSNKFQHNQIQHEKKAVPQNYDAQNSQGPTSIQRNPVDYQTEQFLRNALF